MWETEIWYGDDAQVWFDSTEREVSCLRSARTFNDVEFNFLTFGQGFEAIFLDSGEVNENVAAIFSFDEAITFFCAKPFYFTVHNKILLKKQFQLSCSSSVSVT